MYVLYIYIYVCKYDMMFCKGMILHSFPCLKPLRPPALGVAVPGLSMTGPRKTWKCSGESLGVKKLTYRMGPPR